jgi:hypothetical protein
MDNNGLVPIAGFKDSVDQHRKTWLQFSVPRRSYQHHSEPPARCDLSAPYIAFLLDSFPRSVTYKDPSRQTLLPCEVYQIQGFSKNVRKSKCSSF